jgi:hypothetical protein
VSTGFSCSPYKKWPPGHREMATRPLAQTFPDAHNYLRSGMQGGGRFFTRRGKVPALCAPTVNNKLFASLLVVPFVLSLLFPDTYSQTHARASYNWYLSQAGREPCPVEQGVTPVGNYTMTMLGVGRSVYMPGGYFLSARWLYFRVVQEADIETITMPEG